MKCCLSFIALLLMSPFIHGQSQDSLLAQAYQTHSVGKLEAFFDQWAKETPPLSSAELATADVATKNVYSIFQQFYDPLNLQRIGGSEWGNDIYKKAKYLILQDRIQYGFVDTLDRESLLRQEYTEIAAYSHITMDSVVKAAKQDENQRWGIILTWPKSKKYDSIIDFRPPVLFTAPKTVVLTQKYRILLGQFLGDEHFAFAHDDIMAPARSKGESEKRQQFLESCIKIWYGHWGGYWLLHSYPVVGSITFDRNYQHALVNYSLIYEGGYAYYVKNDGNWKLVDARRTWIQ